MEIYKKFAKDVWIVSISDIAMKLRPLIFLPIITKTLGASDYGVYTTLFITYAFLSPLVEVNLTSSFVRFCSGEKDKKHLSKTFSNITSFSLILAAVATFLFYIFADFLADTVFGAPGSGQVIQIGALFFPLFVLRTLISSYFKARRKMFAFSLFRISFVLIPVFLASVFILMGYGLIEVMYAYIIAYLFIIPAFGALIIRDSGLSLPDFKNLRPYLFFGAPLVVVALSAEVLNMGDRYILGWFMDAAAVGIYAASYNLGKLLVFLLGPITTALLSPLSAAYDRGKMDQVKTYLNYSLRYFIMLSIPTIVGLSLLAPKILRSLTTKEFVTLGAPITPVIALSIFFLGLYSITTQVFLLTQKTKHNALVVALAAIGNVVLNILLIPTMGLMGAAVSTLFAYMALFLITHNFARKHIPIKYDFIFIAKCIVASVPMGLFVQMVSAKGWVNIALTVAASAMIYFVIMYLLKAFKSHELKFFKSFMKKTEMLSAQTISSEDNQE